MSETKWTPGRFSVSHDGANNYRAEVVAEAKAGRKPVVVARIPTPCRSPEQAKANAALFAASPALYGALSDAFDFLGETFGNPDAPYNARAHEVANAARAALARARGETKEG